MGISHYPHSGHRIVPSLLLDVLPVRFHKLDESLRKRVSDKAREQMAEEVIDYVRRNLRSIREQIGSRLLPQLPEGLKSYHLELEVRTYNCLVQAGFGDGLHKLGAFTINRVLALHNFGVKSLLDLLTALEFVTADLATGSDLHLGQSSQSNKHDRTIDSQTLQFIQRALAEKLPVPKKIRRKLLPDLPNTVSLLEGDLKFRTYNSLKKAGFVDQPLKLSGLTIDDLLQLPNFGRDSLFDLLTFLEPFFYSAKQPLVPLITQASQSVLPGVKPTQQSFVVAFADQELIKEAKRLQRMPEAKLIHVEDLRLGGLLRAIDVQSQNAFDAAERLIMGAHTPRKADKTTVQIRQLRTQIKTLSGMKLEDELMSLITGARNDRNKEIVAKRFGLDGGGGCTLQEVGEAYAMTRERIRQICKRVERVWSGKQPFAPTLDRAITFVAEQLPESASEIESRLASRGLARTAFRLEGLDNAAKLLGREAAFSLTEVKAGRIIVAPDAEHLATAIISTARRSITHWGVATIEDVAAQAAKKSSFPAEVVARLLIEQEDFRWLDQATGWFWLRSVPRNRLLNQIEKMLSVTDRIDVAELRRGIGRHHRMKGFAPPQRVLLELCRQTSWCQVTDRMVSACPPIDPKESVSETEFIMFEIMKECGLVLQRERFEEQCLARGMNRTTFYAYLNYSPILTKYARGVYGLCGAHVPIGIVETLAPNYRKGKVLADYGWTPNGKIWIAYKLSESVISSGVCSMPAAMKGFLENQFQLKTEDGSVIGALTSNGTNVWGLKPFFRRRGGETGDYLSLVFDLSIKEVVARIGNEDLLDELEPSDEILKGELTREPITSIS